MAAIDAAALPGRRPTSLPRAVSRTAPLDVSSLLSSKNRAFNEGRTHRQFTFEDAAVRELVDQCEHIRTQHLVPALAQALQGMGRQLPQRNTDEAKEAVANMMRNVLLRLLKVHRPHWRDKKVRLGKDFPLWKHVLKAWVDRTLATLSFDFQTYLSNGTPAFTRLQHGNLRNYTLKLGAWLEAQGVARWDEDAAAASTSDDDIFFVAVGDHSEDQGQEERAPSFVFVDRHRQPVRVPILLGTGTGTGAANPSLVTVLDFVYDLALPYGLADSEEQTQLLHDVARYTGRFGPVLLAMKRGVSREFVRELATTPATAGCCVATLDILNLPVLDLVDPWSLDDGVHDWSCPPVRDSAAVPPGALDDVKALADLEKPMDTLFRRHELAFYGKRSRVFETRELGGCGGLFDGWRARLHIRLNRAAHDAQAAAAVDADVADAQAAAPEAEEIRCQTFFTREGSIDDWEVLADDGIGA